MLGKLIQSIASAAAAAGNWEGVAASMNAPTVPKTSAGTETSLGTVLMVLTQAEAEAVLTALDLSHIGRSGRVKLESRGLDFAHPLTVGLIDQLAAAGTIPATVADKLRSLGRWTVSPAADAGLGVVTAEQCQAAYAAAVADDAARQTAARRAAMRSAVSALVSDQIVGDGALPTLDEAVTAIRAALVSFGAWA